MIKFWNKYSEVFAYLDDDGESIYLWSGEPVAWLSGDAIFTYCGKHLGWMTDEFAYDRFGNHAFYVESVYGLFDKNPLRAPGPRGVQGIRPMRKPTETPPMKPQFSSSRSPYSEELFFSQYD